MGFRNQEKKSEGKKKGGYDKSTHRKKEGLLGFGAFLEWDPVLGGKIEAIHRFQHEGGKTGQKRQKKQREGGRKKKAKTIWGTVVGGLISQDFLIGGWKCQREGWKTCAQKKT